LGRPWLRVFAHRDAGTLGTPIGLLTVVVFLLLPPGAHAASGELVLVSDEDLVSIAADGSAREPLAPSPRGHMDFAPAWAPDGSALAFIRAPVEEEDDAVGTRLMVSAIDALRASGRLRTVRCGR
jgi:hypothetical protein